VGSGDRVTGDSSDCDNSNSGDSGSGGSGDRVTGDSSDSGDSGP
jgi:hypothetical protein